MSKIIERIVKDSIRNHRAEADFYKEMDNFKEAESCLRQMNMAGTIYRSILTRKAERIAEMAFTRLTLGGQS